MSDRSIFVRKPVAVTVSVEGEDEQTLLIHRIPARHAHEWEKVWSEFNPTYLELSPAQMQDFVVRIVKAGIPEPDPACSQKCPCWTGRSGLHELIDRLGREEIDVLYGAVLEANVPKEVATKVAAAGSASTRRWLGLSWPEWASRRPSASRSRSSATSS
jgi:hypothetical protein